MRVLGVIFAGFAMFVAFMFVRDINLAKSSATWPTVSGTVRTSEVSTSTRKGRTRHHFNILYDYAVGGQTFSGSRIRCAGEGSSKAAAEALAAQYPAGASVIVHYFPGDPSECTLKTGATDGSFVVLLFPGVFFLIGVGMLAGSFYMKPSAAL